MMRCVASSWHLKAATSHSDNLVSCTWATGLEGVCVLDESILISAQISFPEWVGTFTQKFWCLPSNILVPSPKYFSAFPHCNVWWKGGQTCWWQYIQWRFVTWMTREIWFDYVDDDHDYEDGDIEEENVLPWHKLTKWVSPRPRLTLGGHNVAKSVKLNLEKTFLNYKM